MNLLTANKSYFESQILVKLTAKTKSLMGKGIKMKTQRRVFAYTRTSYKSLNKEEQLEIIIDDIKYIESVYGEKIKIQSFIHDDDLNKEEKSGLDYYISEHSMSGDLFIISSLDRISLNTKNLINTFELARSLSVHLAVVNIKFYSLDPGSHYFIRCMHDLMEFQSITLKEAQHKGRERAKHEGKYSGRQPTAMKKGPAMMVLLDSGLSVEEVAIETGTSPSSVRRVIKKRRNGELET